MTRSMSDLYPMYTNPGVTEILAKLGPFYYDQPKNDGIKRVKKQIIVLEN